MPYDILTAGDRDAIVTPLLRAHLAPLGLTEIAPRKWVDGSSAPVRRIFELTLMKGCSLKASWGYSLDFVPHISAGHIRWHRSDKTARLDVVIDPISLFQPAYIHGPLQFEADLRRLIPEAARRAKATWDLGSSVETMLALIREIREKRTNCLPYENYSQLPLANAFLLARASDLELGAQELLPLITVYFRMNWLTEESAAKLHHLLTAQSPSGRSLIPGDSV